MLAKLIDLVGTDVEGKMADLRLRDKTGELIYEHQENHPVIGPMKKVCIEHHKIRSKDEKKSEWLYWYWDTRRTTGNQVYQSCGFGGTALPEDWERYHILFV